MNADMIPDWYWKSMHTWSTKEDVSTWLVPLHFEQVVSDLILGIRQSQRTSVTG